MVLHKKLKSLAKKLLKRKGSVLIKDSKWLSKKAKGYYSQVERQLDKKIITSIPEKNSWIKISKATEYAVKALSDSGIYNFDNMLIIVNPYKHSPLTALALFDTKKDYAVRVTVKGKTKDVDVIYNTPVASRHMVPIMGLYADYNNLVKIELLNGKGKTVSKKKIKIKTEPLSGKTTEVVVNKEIETKKSSYPFTLIYGGDDGVYPYSYDRNGDIRFCFALVPKTYGFQPINDGKFLFLSKNIARMTCSNPAALQLFEVDQLGRFHKLYNIEKGSHHDYIELEDGNLVMASNTVEGGVFEDSIIEVDRKTGAVVNEVFLKDYVDDSYITSGDWAHLNSIEYDKTKKTIMVSLRNLHTVLKLNYETKEVLWILSHPKMWEGSSLESKVLQPQGDMEWIFQQHAAYTIDIEDDTDDIKVIIFDNHVDKRNHVEFFDDREESFVRIYSVNEKNKTIKMFKSFECENSNIRSNAIYEPEKNRVLAMGGKLRKEGGVRKGLITEFDYTTGEKVSQYATNYGFYRAYEFKFEPGVATKDLCSDEEYFLGKIRPLEKCDGIDISEALPLPEKDLTNNLVTAEEWNEFVKQQKKDVEGFKVNKLQDVARIEQKLEEGILSVKLIDHLLERIYLVGEKHTYYRDFTDTKQERAVYFSRTLVNEAISLMDLETDEYELYYKHKKGLFKSGVKIRLEEK